MSADPIAEIAVLGLEPTYSAREAAALLGRSYSWLDQRLRRGQFVLPDVTTGAAVTNGWGDRRFTRETLRDIALSSHRSGWFSMKTVRSAFRELAMAADRETGEYNIPS
jgi:hypothetical protein